MISAISLKTFVETYGYLAIILGTIVEGETILIIAGMLSFWGYLNLPLVMIMAFIGSYSGDQFFFFLGRHKGHQLLTRHKKWQSRVGSIHQLLKQYPDTIILAFRFFYGFRLVTPFLLGMDQKIKAGCFAILNGISAVCWSVMVAGGGYFLGEASETILKEIKRWQGGLILGLSLVGLLAWIYSRHKGKKKRRPKLSP
ncbi:MAG: DedA family protein [Pseudomonadota bacterium]